MNREAKQVKHCRQDYRAAVLSQVAPQARPEWLVRWAQRFASALPGVPCRSRTAEYMKASLSNLGPQANVELWQVEQAQEARRALYQRCLRLPWAQPSASPL
jgi:hypothetical protein